MSAPLDSRTRPDSDRDAPYPLLLRGSLRKALPRCWAAGRHPRFGIAMRGAAPASADLTGGGRGQALLYDAALVPVLAFGETDVYDVEHWPWAEALQARMQKLLGFAVPVFHGRGIFNYDFGLLPYRRPITVVVGAPLELRRVSAEGRRAAELGERWLTRDAEGVALVDEWHAAYVEAVRGIYEEHKAKLFPGRVSSMRIS
jgi:hypothetical protein